MQAQENIKEIPINPRIIPQLAKATVKNIIDAAVELITNSDDSYRRLEEQGIKTVGKIEVFVDREKGGRCKTLMVRDYAEGMTRAELEKSIEFAGETSGFESGRSVRGLFGRGLKEAIISLGEGKITTIKDNALNVAEIWSDKNKQKSFYRLNDEVKPVSPELRSKIGIEDGNGTIVEINVSDEKIKVPERDNLKQRIADHYALRDINSSGSREVRLTFHDLKRNLKAKNIPISFQPPEGDLVLDKEVQIQGYGDRVRIQVRKSPTPLDSPRLAPHAKAGILIKTKGAILDNQLFKYDADPAAFYFFGEAYCEGIAERIRKGESGIIDPNRSGIDWHHEYCQALRATIEEILEPLIQEKRRELEKPEKKEVPEHRRKKLKKFCDLLNQLANKEFEEWEPPTEPQGKIEELTIIPSHANLQVDVPRALSVYIPSQFVKLAGNNKAEIRSNNVNIQPLSSSVSLERHKKYADLHYGVFKVVGRVAGEKATIFCQLGEQEGRAYLLVSQPKSKQKGKTPQSRRRGFVQNILPDEASNPIQRVEYVRDAGEIKIYVNFPGVRKYIGSDLSGMETEQGRVIIAELVAEAFCKELARRELEENKRPIYPGAEIDTFNTAVNELQKKYLGTIHEFVAGWRSD